MGAFPILTVVAGLNFAINGKRQRAITCCKL
jgi:hypothetical protein